MLRTDLFTHRFVPALAPAAPGGRARVMIVLHGLGDSLNGFAFLPRALALPDFSYLLVNAPDPYYGGHSWYAFDADPAPGIRRSRDLLLRLLEELKAQGVHPGDVFLFGFSQGCLMALDVALRAPERLGGVVGVSGYVGLAAEYPAAFSPVAKEQRILVTHGLRDPMVPFGPAADQFRELERLGVPLELKIYDKVHTIVEEELDEIREWLLAEAQQK